MNLTDAPHIEEMRAIRDALVAKRAEYLALKARLAELHAAKETRGGQS